MSTSSRHDRRCAGHATTKPGVSKSGLRPKSSKVREGHRVVIKSDDIIDDNGTLIESSDDNESIFNGLSAGICTADVEQTNMRGDISAQDSSSIDGDTLSISDYVHILNDASERMDTENVEDIDKMSEVFKDIYNVLDCKKSETMELCRKLERMKTVMSDVKGKLINIIEDNKSESSLKETLEELAKASRIACETESLACEAIMETERVAEEVSEMQELEDNDDERETPKKPSPENSSTQGTEVIAEEVNKESPIRETKDTTLIANDSTAADDESTNADDDAKTVENDNATQENNVITENDKTANNENDTTGSDDMLTNGVTPNDDDKSPENVKASNDNTESEQPFSDKYAENMDEDRREFTEGKSVEEDNQTSPPPQRPTSPIMNNKDKPLEWPHFKMHIQGDEEVSCFLRCRDGELSSSSLTCSLGNICGDAIKDSEEVISNCITLRRSGGQDDYELLSYPIVIAIPYQINARLANTKELVVKQRVIKEEELSEDNPKIVKTIEWKILQPLAIDSSITDFKGQFVEVAVTRLTSYAVVARMVKDKMTISKKGGVIKSTAEHRVAVTYPQGACTLINVSLQVQPAESVANDLKTRFRHCSDLIGASPILHMKHTPSKKFEKPVTISMPCPPNPNKGNTPGKNSKTEKKEISPMLPEGAIIIRKTKKSSMYGSDAADDFLHALYKQSENGTWNDLEKVEIKQVRKDVVSLDLKKPVESLLVLRMGVETKYTPKQIATTFEQALQVKYANIILYHKVEQPEKIIVQIVHSRQLDSALRRLNNDDYDGPPYPSPEIPMTEGQEITLRLTGNVKIVGHDELKITFHTQRTNVVEFTVKEDNKFGNYSSSEYRGVAEFYGRSRVAIDEPDDPEEILLRESEAKAAEKANKSSDFGAVKSQKEQKAKEKIENVSKPPTDLLCKLAVSIPKSEPDPLMPPSRYRTTALDSEGMVSNDNFQWLSGELGSEWETLALYLGIKRNRIQSIKRNNPMKIEEQILDMLITWRSMMPKAYNKERKLNAALVKCGRYDLSEELKERKKDVENDKEKE